MVNSLLLLILLGGGTAPAVHNSAALIACTAQRLKPFVDPLGIKQSWPVAEELSPQFHNSFGTLISDQGPVADGYMHTLHVDVGERKAYVVELGGFAGRRKVYGPLPVAVCAAPLT